MRASYSSCVEGCQTPSPGGRGAVDSMRCDATEIAARVTEVLAYGTAVVIEPDRR